MEKAICIRNDWGEVKRFRSIAGVLVSGVVFSVSLVSPAYAEGNWSSSISGALTGFMSRSWTDNNTDSASTRTVWSGCSLGGPTYRNTTLDLSRDRGALLPDQVYGQRTSNCGTFDWGRMTDKGSYHWTIKKINDSESGYRISVNSVKTYY